MGAVSSGLPSESTIGRAADTTESERFAKQGPPAVVWRSRPSNAEDMAPKDDTVTQRSRDDRQ
ncbi:hypothetical protein CP880_03055 [Cutibacterium namnetense]|uniref:Uncharacterized protein n=1 Tax=Cutibacterium namnetense TaxID=1574624 RepID=A0ABX9IBB7_9ACTN|nr:hypothetical protein CP880_03055 [Cutibacterium namnetense]TKW72364.1 MAG: hypothetical protein DI580_04315 [Cutibacterium acnes]